MVNGGGGGDDDEKPEVENTLQEIRKFRKASEAVDGILEALNSGEIMSSNILAYSTQLLLGLHLPDLEKFRTRICPILWMNKF
jgi:hypothetical protein